MRYFIVLEDERIKEPVKVDQYTEKEAKDLQDIVIFTECRENTKYVAYIKKRFLFDSRHIVSDTVKDVLEMYTENLPQKGIFITDTKTLDQYIYWEIQPEKVDCIGSGKVKKIQEAGFIKEEIQNRPFLAVPFEKQEYLVVRIDVAESILRRSCTGIRFHEAIIV